MTSDQRPGLRAYEDSVRLPFHEVVSELREMLGVRLVAYIGGVKSARSVSTWAEGTGTPGEVDLLFGDGISLAFWLNGTESNNCCAFRGGPFIDSRYFGEGVGIAVRRGNDPLRLGFNWALFRLWERGRFSDLWLRYFPVSPF